MLEFGLQHRISGAMVHACVTMFGRGIHPSVHHRGATLTKNRHAHAAREHGTHNQLPAHNQLPHPQSIVSMLYRISFEFN